MAPIPRLILHNQPALNKFGRCKQYTIDSMETRLIDGIFDWKRAWTIKSINHRSTSFPSAVAYNSGLFTSELKNHAVHGYPKTK